MSADKRIAVTKDTWKRLGDIKSAGQTYDDVIDNLIEEHEKAELFDRIRESRENSEFVPLDEV
jgi:predicted CopG family antitoxin